MIEIISEEFKIDAEYFYRIIDFLCRDLNISDNATIKIGNDKESRDLNREYRNKDYPTDVLTFPINEKFPDGLYLGDILIAYPVMEKQAKEAGISEKDELMTLITHGILHLIGYDHETDNGEMLVLQEKLLKKIKSSF